MLNHKMAKVIFCQQFLMKQVYLLRVESDTAHISKLDPEFESDTS